MVGNTGDRSQQPRVAEFFAGIGLVREGLEAEGFKVVFANDIDETKKRVYEANASGPKFVLSDIRELTGNDIPDVELAAASFPCTDVSVAGARAGLDGKYSGLVHDFLRLLGEMGGRRPEVIVLENVLGFATSKEGEDLRGTIEHMNSLGYVCDIIVLDAARFLPQSRPRIFIIAWPGKVDDRHLLFASDVRPPWIIRFRERHQHLGLQALDFPPLPYCSQTLANIVDKLEPDDPAWWGAERLQRFVDSLSHIQSMRLRSMMRAQNPRWATAYRRTRHRKAVWEIRGDEISGCLRTGKGGSSRQALVQAGKDGYRVRWMTAREYCRLQGAPGIDLAGITENQGRFALGDAVCVPVISWLARSALLPLLSVGNDCTLAKGPDEAHYGSTEPQL